MIAAAILVPKVLFYVFSIALVGSALLVITARNPVYAVLCLILAFFNSAGLFILLGAEFIAMLMVIVYVGAVAVLFLFVVMMLNVDFAAFRSQFVKNLPVALLVAVILCIELILIITFAMYELPMQVIFDPLVGNDGNQGVMHNTQAIGAVLYTRYVYAFQIAGLVLLVAMIGAISLTLRDKVGTKKQDIGRQVARTRKDGVQLVNVETRRGV